MAAHTRSRGPSRLRTLAQLTLVGALALPVLAMLPQQQAAAASTPQFTATVKEQRAHLVNGADDVVDTRTVTVSVDRTTNLRDREPINVSWTGAHPTGGIAVDPNSAAASEQEYPVVIMQCRGVDSTTVTASKRVSPETCWTQTPGERYVSRNLVFPPYRIDRYASPADRTASPGQPTPYPEACAGVSSGTDHWVPFIASNGTVYPGGPNGCAGLPPEANNGATSLQPGNTTYAASDLNGAGSAKFIVNTEQSNASIGCSTSVPCTLEIIPIIGISCDAAGAATPGLGADDIPPRRDRPLYETECEKTGNYPAGLVGGGADSEAIAVSGRLWWSASNWRNRIAVPLNFAKDATSCSITGTQSASLFYGSQIALPMIQQWAPTFCTDSKLNPIRLVQTSETEAKNLLRVGTIKAAIQAGPPDSAFSSPTVQAPIGLSGFAIAFYIDDANGHPWKSLRLDARLIAKLLTQSYAGEGVIAIDYPELLRNPYDIGKDPEFRALNPQSLPEAYSGTVASALYTISSDSDMMVALTSYINADPEARAWLDGYPDPWGMVVNPHYRAISLPVTSWPFLDPFIPKFIKGSNQCLFDDPVPWFTQVQAPVADPNAVALNMQYGIANSQTVCSNPGLPNEKLVAIGRLTPGSRLMMGIVSLADAARYQLDVAQLQTSSNFIPGVRFTDATGRTFASPDTTGLSAAVGALTIDDSRNTWKFPYAAMRTDASLHKAYPGALLLSADIATQGLSRSAAADYANFLSYAVTNGQVPGTANGMLAAGYQPLAGLPAASTLVAYTTKAEAAVRAQQGFVPSVTGNDPTPTPTPTPSASTTIPSTGTPSTQPTQPSASPTPSATPTPSASPTVVAIVPVGKTTSILPGGLADALPVLLAVAALCGGAALVTIYWGRT